MSIKQINSLQLTTMNNDKNEEIKDSIGDLNNKLQLAFATCDDDNKSELLKLMINNNNYTRELYEKIEKIDSDPNFIKDNKKNMDEYLRYLIIKWILLNDV